MSGLGLCSWKIDFLLFNFFCRPPLNFNRDSPRPRSWQSRPRNTPVDSPSFPSMVLPDSDSESSESVVSSVLSCSSDSSITVGSSSTAASISVKGPSPSISSKPVSAPD